MSVFDGVPDPLPFDADISQRPATFVLRPERSDRYIIGFIALFWLLFGPVLTALVVASLALAFGLLDYLRPVLIASAVIAFVVYIWWWWAEFIATFRVVNVTISDDSVDVHERDLVRNRTWSHLLTDYEGVGIVNLGTRLIGFSKTPLASVMLKHPDPARSVPLAIDRANRIGRPAVNQKARQLGVPALAGISGVKGKESYPADAIVVNRRQALKMRLIQAGAVLALLFFAGSAIRQYGVAEPDPVWAIIAMIFVAVLIAIQMYARQYVFEMRQQDAEIALRTGAILFPWRRFPRQRIRALDHKEGRMSTYKHTVHTPYVKMRVEGYTFPFVIDMQSDFVDEGRLRGLAMSVRPVAPAKKGRRRRR